MEHKGLRPLIHPGVFRQSLRGRSLAAPLSLSIRDANCPGHRFCRGPGRAFGGRRIQTVALQWAILPDVHAAGTGSSGGGGLRYPRWMAFCDCRRPPFSPALPVSTPTPPGWRSRRLLRRAFSSCRQSRSSPCGAVPLGIRFPALPMAQPPAEFPQKHVYAGPACLFPPFFRVAAASAAMACARVEIQYIGNRKKEQSLHRNGNIGTVRNQ